MQLYLNVIEFGPDLYGIGKAAFHYSRGEALTSSTSRSRSFLALTPSVAAPLFQAGRETLPSSPEGWMTHLRQAHGDRGEERGTISSPRRSSPKDWNEEVIFHGGREGFNYRRHDRP